MKQIGEYLQSRSNIEVHLSNELWANNEPRHESASLDLSHIAGMVQAGTADVLSCPIDISTFGQ